MLNVFKVPPIFLVATKLARKQYSTKVKHLSVLMNCGFFCPLKSILFVRELF